MNWNFFNFKQKLQYIIIILSLNTVLFKNYIIFLIFKLLWL